MRDPIQKVPTPRQSSADAPPGAPLVGGALFVAGIALGAMGFGWLHPTSPSDTSVPPPEATSTGVSPLPSMSVLAPPVQDTPIVQPIPAPRAPTPTADGRAPLPCTANEHTPIPSEAAWNAVGENTVTHSSSLHCETKRIHEWQRVVCSSPSATNPVLEARINNASDRASTWTWKTATDVRLLLAVRTGTDTQVLFGWKEWGWRDVNFKCAVNGADARYFNQGATGTPSEIRPRFMPPAGMTGPPR